MFNTTNIRMVEIRQNDNFKRAPGKAIKMYINEKSYSSKILSIELNIDKFYFRTCATAR